jgi:cell division protein FtsX
MKTRYKIIIGISIPLVLFGIFVLLIAINVSHMLENSERWMVELEPHLDLSDDQLESQLRNEDLKELTLYRVKTLEDYFESFNTNWERQAKEAFDTEHRFVVSIDENHEYSEQQIQEIFTNIDGIKEALDLHDWLLGRD